MESDGVVELEESLEDGLYIPLQRVTSIASQLSITKSGANDLDDDLDSPSCSDNETDSDSDNQFKPKKPKVKHSLKALSSSGAKPKSYNIWANVQEDALTESLVGCGVSQDVFDTSRNVESYDYRKGYAASNKFNSHNSKHSVRHRHRRFSSESIDGNPMRKLSSDNDSADSTFSRKRSFSDCKRYEKSFRKHVNKRKFQDRNSMHRKLGEKPNLDDEDSCNSKFKQLNLLDLTTTAEDTEENVANDIATKLYEPKDSLILRAVKALGKEKAIQLFYETQRIECEGGMAIMGGHRRRTPGGVFIFLIKHDDAITKEQRKEMFIEDRKFATKKKKASSQKKHKEGFKNFKQMMQDDKDLPRLLSRSEATVEMLTISNASEGEHIDVNEENVVTNPPPSPVTDGGRENSSDTDMFQASTSHQNSENSMDVKLLNKQTTLVELSYGDAMDIF